MKEKFVQVGTNKIRYLEGGGSDGNVLLVHGLGASADRWLRVIPQLSKKYHVIVPDLIGFGFSDKPSVDYTPEFFSQFIFDFLKTLGITKTSMIGSSLGGQIVAECAITQSEMIEKIVLVSPSGIMKQSTPTLDAYTLAALYPTQDGAKTAFQMMAGVHKEIDSDTIDDFIQHMTLPNAKMAFMSTMLGVRNSIPLSERLAKISAPTLIVWGKHDTLIPITYSKDVVSSIKNCQFVEMENSGHTPYVEEPEKFSEIVLRFLNQQMVVSTR
ncbi:MAG: alpha/beta hydrolase [Thaumarchaeota archaeon]|nr:alpha/beta hydrolase [Nitrososphaerota archaeon]